MKWCIRCACTNKALCFSCVCDTERCTSASTGVTVYGTEHHVTTPHSKHLFESVSSTRLELTKQTRSTSSILIHVQTHTHHETLFVFVYQCLDGVKVGTMHHHHNSNN